MIRMTQKVRFITAKAFAVAPVSNRSRRKETLGPNEQAVMLGILHRGNYAYGSEVNMEIEKRTGRSLSVGVLYNTIDRLAKKGLIDAAVHEDKTSNSLKPTKNGKRKRFSLTGSGEATLNASLQFIDQMRADNEEYPDPQPV